MEQLKYIKKTNPNWFLTFGQEENIYTAFIKNCRSKTYLVNPDDPLSTIHSHHIIPRHLLNETDEELAYCESSENLIDLSVADHICAHELFNKVYPSPQNQGSIFALRKSIKLAQKCLKQAGAAASHMIQREKKVGIFNPDLASEIGRKGAKASLARPDAIEIRREAGKVGGAKRHTGNIVGEGDKIVWYYNPERVGSGTQTSDPGEAVCCTFNCETGGQIVQSLNSIYPSNLTRISPVLTGERKSAYGWSCERIDPSEDFDEVSEFEELDEFGKFSLDLPDETEEDK